jgi:hypothetical protein
MTLGMWSTASSALQDFALLRLSPSKLWPSTSPPAGCGMSRRASQLGGVFLLAVAFVAAAAAAPESGWGNHTGPGTGNDQLSGALELEEFFTEDFDFTDDPAASIQSGEPFTVAGPGFCENEEMGATLWWFVAGNGGPITVTTRGSDFDTLVAVYRGDTGDSVGCSNNVAADVLQAELVFPSIAGVDYLIQVGGLCLPSDQTCQSPRRGLVVINTFDAPANDDRANARALTAGSPLTGQDNFGATVESGEQAACGDRPYGKTVWYRWVAPATGDAVFSASSSNAALDPVLSLHLGGGPSVACNDDVSDTDTQAQVSRRVEAGETYLVQVGGFGANQAADDGSFSMAVQFTPDADLDDDGSSPPADCNDLNAAVHPGASDINNGIDDDCTGVTDPDLDADGYKRPPEGPDCNDTPGAGRATNPGARDIPGNRVNEDCRGAPAPFKRLRSDTDYSWNFKGSGIEITTPLVVRGVPRGGRVRLTCSRQNGSSCGKFRRRRGAKPVKFAQLRGKDLPAGTVMVIRVTKAAHIGRFIEITIRQGREPQKEFSCMNPGSSRPRNRCPLRR